MSKRGSRRVLFVSLMLSVSLCVATFAQSRSDRAKAELGESLFRETEFTQAGFDFSQSCDVADD